MMIPVAVSALHGTLIVLGSLIAAVGAVVMLVNLWAIVPARQGKLIDRPLVGLPAQVTRRKFFGRSLLVGFAGAMTSFGGISLAFLWPNLKGGFGGKVSLATPYSEIVAQIAANRQPFYYAPGRFYLVAYDESNPNGKIYASQGLVAGGLMALYQRCVHLGCRVPFCQNSQWFECPCHGSKYNRAGEYKLGPAPRGLDRFPITVANGVVTVDTGVIITGPPRGTNTTGQEPEGPFCVGQVGQTH
ncbi:MAG: Rieske 2Fe-2S domain-containing protein [Acidobacteria bacterium]|nr:Rieske 2Fe-2S domain-containing protein [Acidobacteriota bacterium]